MQILNFPQITVTGQSNLGNTTGGANAVRGPVTTVAANLEKIIRKHTLSFGFMGVDMLFEAKACIATRSICSRSLYLWPEPISLHR